MVKKEEFDELNPDGEKIKNVFIRDEQYYIRINDKFKHNTTIEEFYRKLHLGSELHRLDYLIMNIIGLQRFIVKIIVIYMLDSGKYWI